MKSLILSICISALFFLNTTAQISYHVYGTIDRTDVERIYLRYDKVLKDSALVIDGKYDMKGSYKSPTVAMVVTQKPFSASKIVLDNSEYNVNLDAKMKATIVTTSINHNLWLNSLSNNHEKAKKKATDSLLNDYKLQIEKGIYKESEQYLTKYREIQLRLLNYYKKLVLDHTDCYIIPYLLGGQDILTQENFGSTFEKLSPEVKNNEWGQKFRTTLETKKTPKPDKTQFDITILGTMAQYFETKKVNGEVFNLASLKGKWVLLDFWASWCVPCRAELPFLKKAFDQFKDKNFVISSVSLDSKTADWQKALIEDNTPQFVHTIIAESVKSDGFKFYNTTTIPANFLITPEGRIVALDLRGEELSKTLSKCIK